VREIEAVRQSRCRPSSWQLPWRESPQALSSASLSPAHFGDIAVVPSGQIAVAYESPFGGQGPATIFVNTDPDGWAPVASARP
jgi:hypothetical protein